MGNMRKTVKNPTQCWLVVDNYSGDVEREFDNMQDAIVYAEHCDRLFVHNATFEGMDREYIQC